MIITSVDKKGNNVLVEFDENERIKIPLEIYQKNSLYINCDVSTIQKEKIETESEKFTIKESSFRYLSIRNHSKFELKQKLRKKRYREDLIEEVIIELTEYGYLNDEQFAKDYYGSKIKKNVGPLKIKAGLYKKGVDRNIIEHIDEINFDEDQLLENAIKVAEKKYRQLNERHIEKNKMKQKLYSFLLNKGYSSEIIGKALSNLVKCYE